MYVEAVAGGDDGGKEVRVSAMSSSGASTAGRGSAMSRFSLLGSDLLNLWLFAHMPRRHLWLVRGDVGRFLAELFAFREPRVCTVQ